MERLGGVSKVEEWLQPKKPTNPRDISKHFLNPPQSHTASCPRTNLQTLHQYSLRKTEPSTAAPKERASFQPSRETPKSLKISKRQPVSVVHSSSHPALSLLQNPRPSQLPKLASSFLLNTAFPPLQTQLHPTHFSKPSLCCKISTKKTPERDPHSFQKALSFLPNA